MTRPVVALLVEARRVLGLNQAGLGKLLRCGVRTVQRWEKGTSKPSATRLQLLATKLESKDPSLAAELDAWAPRPQPATRPAAPRFLAPLLVDSVVCAGAEAMAVSPQTLRPALRAALVRARDRARDAGLTVDELIQLLSKAPSANG